MEPFVRAFPFFLALLAPACGSDDGGGGDVGAPCDVDEDCAEGLSCDIHDGRGSCQKPHED